MDINIRRNIVNDEPEYNNEESVRDYNYKTFEPPKMLFYWHAVSRWALILFAGLAPIFFLPFTNLPVAANKEFLVFSLILIALFALLGRILIEGKIRYPGHMLTLALIILVLVWGASAFFSLNPLTSLIGPWLTPDSFATILLFAILALAAAATFNRKDVMLSILVFLASVSLLGVFEIFQLLKIYVLPFSFAKNAAFNTVGSVNDLGILFAFGLVIASGLMAALDLSKILKKLLGISVVILLVNLIIIDFWAIWAGLILAMIFLISFLSSGLSSKSLAKEDQNGQQLQYRGLQPIYFQKAWLPSIVLLISLLFLFIPSPLANFIQTPVEVSPNFTATLNIALANLKVGHYLVGSGPNTFNYIFNLYKPDGINQTIFWSTVFNSGFSAMATWAGTVGILGTLAILFLIFAFIWTGMRGAGIRGASRGATDIATQSIFVGVIYLFLTWFLYAVSFTTLAFAFWGMGLFLAAALSFIEENKPTPTLPYQGGGKGEDINSSLDKGRLGRVAFREIWIFTSPPKTFILSLLIVGLMVASLAGIYFEANRYIAEIYFSNAVLASNQNKNDEAINNVARAIQFWSYDERYFQSLAQLIFFQLNDLLAKKDLPQDQARARFQNITTNAIAAAKQAQSLNPKNPFNSMLLGNIYENLVPFIADASNFALSSYGAAIALDPKNPSYRLASARVEVAQADLAIGQKAEQAQIDGYLNKAILNLEDAINLKSDYAPAIFLEVQIYDRRGKLADAVKRAEQLVMLNNTDVGSLFQLGFLYYKAQRFDESRQVFERTIELSPNYSNARYFLGLIYDKAGEKDKAREQFTKISELNPDNAEIRQILINLKNKKPALFGIAPPAPAPQNREAAPIQEGVKAPVQKLKK